MKKPLLVSVQQLPASTKQAKRPPIKRSQYPLFVLASFLFGLVWQTTFAYLLSTGHIIAAFISAFFTMGITANILIHSVNTNLIFKYLLGWMIATLVAMPISILIVLR